MKTQPDLIGDLPDLDGEQALRDVFDPQSQLTINELHFVAKILDGNTQSTAYLATHPQYKGANQNTLGNQMANRPHVKAAIEAALQRSREEARGHASKHVGRLLDEYLRLAFVDPAKLLDNTGRPLPLSEIDEDTRRAIVGLEVLDEFEGRGDQRQQIGTVKKYKLADKQKAMDSLAKVLGLLVDKTEVTGKDGAPLVPAAEISDNELARRIAFVLQKAQQPQKEK